MSDRHWNQLTDAERAAERERVYTLYLKHHGNASAAARESGRSARFVKNTVRFRAMECPPEKGGKVPPLAVEPVVPNPVREVAGVKVDFGDVLAQLEALKAQVQERQRVGEAAPVVEAVEPEPIAETPEPDPDPIEETRRKIESRRELKMQRDLLMDIAGEQSFRAFLEDLMREVAPRVPAPPKYVPPKFKSGQTGDVSNETMLMLLSDWHAYEIVKNERVLGLNEYGAHIMGRRAKRIITSAVSIKDRMERGGGWRFPRCVVACNGDFVSGTIHEVEKHSDAPSVIQAVYGTGLVLASALRDLAAHFEHIDVYCTSGNHGRLPDARKMQQKDPTRNWDTAIYLYAKTALMNVPNVKFHIPDSYAVMYEVNGWRFLQIHGHDIKSWNNIPFYGIDRYGRNINALMTAKQSPIHFILCSHFHSSGGISTAAGGETFINGSLIGGTEFGVNALGKCDEPTQWLFCIHENHGIASRWPLHGNGDDIEAGYEVYPWAEVG